MKSQESYGGVCPGDMSWGTKGCTEIEDKGHITKQEKKNESKEGKC